MAEVDSEEDRPRNNISRVRLDRNEADRRNGERGMVQGDFMYCLDHAGAGHHGIVAQVHGRAAGMSLLPGHGDLVPSLSLHAGDHTNQPVFRLQYRPLLDVKFKIGTQFMVAAFPLAAVADALQFRHKCFSVAVLNGIGKVTLKNTGEHPRGQHRWREARAFLVGPVNQFQRGKGGISGFVQRAQHLKA